MVYFGYNTGVVNRKVDRGATGIAHGLSKFYLGELTMSHSNPQPSALKVCSKCGEAKPLTQFTQRKTGRQAGSYEARCKECMRAASAAYRSQFPERAAEASRRSNDKTREQRNIEYRDRIAKDLEYRKKRNDKSRAWREGNREHIAQYNAARYDDDPQRMRAAVKSSHAAYPEHLKARKSVAWAVKAGTFPPAWTMVCERCQEAQAAQYHHHKGYDPEFKLDVIALCTECHGKEHQSDD